MLYLRAAQKLERRHRRTATSDHAIAALGGKAVNDHLKRLAD